jgi:hypothetical protein
MAQLFWLSGQQLLDGNGKPYAAAKAFFYDTGTTTPKATYSDAGLTAINANPVVADSEGHFPDIYLVAGRYKVDLRTTANVSIDVLDPVDATQQLISSASAPATTYAFLRYHNTSDGNVYRRNAANSGWILEGPVDSLLNAASTSDVLTGTDTTKAVTPDALAALWQRGTDIASASPLSLPAGGGGVFTVTGTSTVNGITTAHGGRRVALRFSGSLQLTHSASFILPGGVNITTAAGDQAEFINDAAQDASGSNWRCVSYLRANGTPVIDSPWPTIINTASYTVTPTDANAFIGFGLMTGATTLSLPPAASFAGQKLFVRNSSPSYGVTIDPNGSETIDGVATRRTFGVSVLTIFSDGSQWLTTSGRYLYFSGDQTITSGGGHTLAHGLGVKPVKVWGELLCTTASGGYAPGDIINMGVHYHDGTNMRNAVIRIDATNIVVQYAALATNVFSAPNKTTGALENLANTSWSARYYAEAY